MTDNELSYAARCKCGVIVAATLISSRRHKENARDVAQWIRAGLSIEQLTPDEVRAQFGECTCRGGAERDGGQLPLFEDGDR